jgi:hypothetical protein
VNRLLRLAAQAPSVLASAPDNLQAKNAAKVFVEWIKKHPEYETQSAANAFVLAMREKYSCR